MNPYHSFIQEFSDLLKKAEGLKAQPQSHPPQRATSETPTVFIFSPHPDDEVIVGALPYRFLKENNYRVINVAVTLGSKLARRKERLAELTSACDSVGFELVLVGKEGLSGINLETKKKAAVDWEASVQEILELVQQHRPDYLFFPHAKDANSTHMGVHSLICDALLQMEKAYSPICLLTEFWSPMEKPNLMVESSCLDLSELVNALALHVGEVERNPYHLLLPCWMKDNVRRGAEIIGGQGMESPDFTFATLYRAMRWSEKKLIELQLEQKFVSSDTLCLIK